MKKHAIVTAAEKAPWWVKLVALGGVLTGVAYVGAMGLGYGLGLGLHGLEAEAEKRLGDAEAKLYRAWLRLYKPAHELAATALRDLEEVGAKAWSAVYDPTGKASDFVRGGDSSFGPGRSDDSDTETDDDGEGFTRGATRKF